MPGDNVKDSIARAVNALDRLEEHGRKQDHMGVEHGLRIERTEDDVTELRHQLVAAQEQFKAIERAHNTDVQALRGEIQALRVEVSALRGDILAKIATLSTQLAVGGTLGVVLLTALVNVLIKFLGK